MLSYHSEFFIKIYLCIALLLLIPTNTQPQGEFVGIEGELPVLSSGLILDFSFAEHILYDSFYIEENMSVVDSEDNSNMVDYEEDLSWIDMTTMEELVIEPEEFASKYEEALGKNSDVVGWIPIPDSHVDYPILYRDNDNTFYLSHNSLGNKAAAGGIFLDSSSNGMMGTELSPTDGVTFLQGHSMKNGTIFGDLLEYKDQDFFDGHQMVYMYAPETGLVEYRIFSVILINAATEGVKVAFNSMIERLGHYNEIVGRSMVDISENINLLDVLVLGTCSYEGDNTRCLVYASRV